MPNAPEQEAIAEALSDADALIESLEQLIAKKRQIKQGAMQELLTGKKRLPGFRGAWETTKLGNLLSVCHGKSQKSIEKQDGKFPILASGGLIGHTDSYLCDTPSVLIGRKGTIDRPQFMTTPFWTVDTLFYTKVYPPNNAHYLFYRFWLVNWNRHNEASGVPSLNARTIEQIEIEIPPSDEQSAIAEVLSAVDEAIAMEEAKLAKARQIKQGMMQELLTGRIRLV
jgi:type I restriction enzyme S subunit